MSVHHFGLGNGQVSDREYARIERSIRASGEEANFVRYNDPTGQIRYWFNCRNRGCPFDDRTASAVLAAVGHIKTKQANGRYA